ncbi:hypothetical protein ACXYMU_01375 [Pontibacter sp. CAU 1760]
MEEKKTPLQEHTKDDSSDVEKVKQGNQAPPPQPHEKPQATEKPHTKEEEEAEKGHS